MQKPQDPSTMGTEDCGGKDIAGCDPNPISPSVSSDSPQSPADWSVASAESLFSIQMGIGSFNDKLALNFKPAGKPLGLDLGRVPPMATAAIAGPRSQGDGGVGEMETEAPPPEVLKEFLTEEIPKEPAKVEATPPESHRNSILTNSSLVAV